MARAQKASAGSTEEGSTRYCEMMYYIDLGEIRSIIDCVDCSRREVVGDATGLKTVGRSVTKTCGDDISANTETQSDL